MTETQMKPKSDLAVRAMSAVVMVAVAGGVFWAGGIWLDIFVGCIALAVFVEFCALVLKATPKISARLAALLAGLVYVGGAAAALILTDEGAVHLIVGAVIAVDVFAYFAGRKFGGPKIAPSISPSKTWAGLGGGALGACVFLTVVYRLKSAFYGTQICQSYYDFIDSFGPPLGKNAFYLDGPCHMATAPFNLTLVGQMLIIGISVAVFAQAGDFLESWMKRRAGVKDSSNFIPGHGGVFDRTDGMIAVAFVFGIIMLVVKQIMG